MYGPGPSGVRGSGLVNELYASIYSGDSVDVVRLDESRLPASFESLFKPWASADAVVVWGEGAWRHAPALLRAAGRAGFNPYAVDVVDSVEPRLSGLSMDTLVGLRARRIASGRAWEARSRVAPSKRLTRRALLRNPLASIMEYVAAPVVDAAACLELSHCSLCLDSCPYQAIAGKPPRVDPDSCVECMECVYSCPAWALSPPGYSRSGFTEYLDGLLGEGFTGALVVAEYRVLADLYELASSGVGGVAVMPVHSLSHLHPRTAVEASSRGVRLAAYDPQGSSPAWLLEAEESGLASRASSPGELVGLLPAGSEPGSGGESPYPFAATVLVDGGKCTLCGACVKACPRGALEIRQARDALELILDEGKCIGCAECAAVCPQDAIEVRWLARAPLGESKVRLAWDEVHRCPVCGSIVGPKKQVEAVAAKLRAAGLPEAAVSRVYLCPTCRATRLDFKAS